MKKIVALMLAAMLLCAGAALAEDYAIATDTGFRPFEYTDDDGNDVSFEIIGSVEYSERIFLVAIPFDEEDEDLVIIEVIEGDEEDSEEFVAVEDEALAMAVYEEFKKNYEGEYEFE